MNITTIEELITMAHDQNCTIGEAILKQEAQSHETTLAEAKAQMLANWQVMKDSITPGSGTSRAFQRRSDRRRGQKTSGVLSEAAAFIRQKNGQCRELCAGCSGGQCDDGQDRGLSDGGLLRHHAGSADDGAGAAITFR